MKKTTFLIAAMIFTVLAQAQKLDAAKVPAAVKSSFAKQCPGVAVLAWEMEDSQYEASYKKDGKSMSASFKPDGIFTESETDITVNDLPVPIKNYMKDHYKGMEVKEAARITKASGEVNYEAEIKGKDVIFNSAGKFIKEAKD